METAKVTPWAEFNMCKPQAEVKIWSLKQVLNQWKPSRESTQRRLCNWETKQRPRLKSCKRNTNPKQFPVWWEGFPWKILAWDEAPEPIMPRRPATTGEPQLWTGKQESSGRWSIIYTKKYVPSVIDLCIYGTYVELMAREMAISLEIIKALWTSNAAEPRNVLNCVGWQATAPGRLIFWGANTGFIARYNMKLKKHCKSSDPWLQWKVYSARLEGLEVVRALLSPRAGLCCSAEWGSVLLWIVLKENTEKTWNRYFWHIVSKPLCGCILGPVWNGLWHFLAVWWSWNREFAVCIHYQNVWAANCTINNQGKRRLIECLCFFWNWNLITSAPPCLTTCKFQQQLHCHSSNVLYGNIPSSQAFGSYILNHPKTKNRPPLLGMVLCILSGCQTISPKHEDLTEGRHAEWNI